MKYKIILLLMVVIITISACSNSDKPSKEEVVKRFNEQLISNEDSLTDDDKKELDEYSKCLVDEIYSKLSAETLKKIIDAKTYDEAKKVQDELSNNENEIFNNASSKCFSIDSLQSAKKSGAKVGIRNAQSTVVATQAGLGATDFSGLTLDVLVRADPDLNFVDTALGNSEEENVVAIFFISPVQIVLQSRSSKDVCYFVQLNSSSATQYGAEQVSDSELCPLNTTNYADDQKTGWVI